MVALSYFEQLEGSIDKLIRLNDSLKEENRVLLKRLQQKDQDIQKLIDDADRFHKQRNLIYPKVLDLIDRLDNIVRVHP